MNKLIILVAALVSCSAWAEGEDLENCLYKNGGHIEFRVCELLKAEKAQDDLRIKQQADYASGADLKNCRWNTGTVIDASYCEKLRKKQVVLDAEQARKEQEKEHNKQVEREWAEKNALEEAENKRARAEWKRKEAKEEAARKRKCGKDYDTLRIGMTLDHLEQCVGAIYTTKTVGKGGVVATYRTMFDWVHVQNGRVISYTERTDN